MKDVVDELICRTVTYAGGNKVRAAKILGVNRRTIYSRLENYEVHETNGRVNGRPYRNGRNGLTVTARTRRTWCGLWLERHLGQKLSIRLEAQFLSREESSRLASSRSLALPSRSASTSASSW